MAFLLEYASFLLKAITIVIAIIVVFAFIFTLRSQRRHDSNKGQLQIQKLNEQFDKLNERLEEAILDKSDFKKQQKQKAKQLKADRKITATQKRIFVLDFVGDIKASAVENLRQEITAVLMQAKPTDEVVVRLESPGGMVHGYGLAASQLARLREANIPLTICVDKVAASGGYMMACIANQILSAPFAILGSIGVVAQLPNFHRLLKKNEIDYEILTAGEYKRTLTVFGENTEKGREKFKEELEITHQLFKQFVSNYRPQLNIDQIATGETWFGQEALTNHLVDKITTSDQYLLEQSAHTQLLHLHFAIKKPLPERLGLGASNAVEQITTTCLDKLNQLRFWR